MYRIYVIAIIVTLGIAGCSFAPSGGDKPVINNFTAEPTSVARGGGTTLSWRVTNATGVDIDQGVGVVARNSGSTVIYPGASTSYRLTATNASGSNTAMAMVSVGESAQANTVPSSQPVSAGLNPPLVYNFWADPSTFIKGGSTKLSWNVLGANSIRIDPSVGVVKTTGSVNVTPFSSTTYTLTATNSGGSVWATEEVHVLPQTPIVPAINWFAASPSTILEGNTSTISWRTTNAQSVTISGIGAVATSGKRVVAPRTTTQYVMEATTATGRFQDAVTVVVQSMNPTVYYQYSPDIYPRLYRCRPITGPAVAVTRGQTGIPLPAAGQQKTGPYHPMRSIK
jgi:hypothetical protein